MKLTFYLFNESVTDFQQAIALSKLSGDNPFEEIHPKDELPFEAKAYFQKNKETSPKWMGFIAGHFDLDPHEIHNRTNSFLLLAKIRDRIFAVSTGFGANAIERSKIEPGFGLRVTLNEIDPQKIKGIDVRKIDTATKQKRVLINRNSPLFDFDFDLDEELLSLVSGQPKDSDLARRLVGSDSLSVTANISFEEIGAKCEALFDAFSKDDYKVNFGFIDHLRIVKNRTLLKGDLDRLLVSSLNGREAEKILLAYPEIDNWNQIENFKLMYKYKSQTLEEVEISGVYAFLDRYEFIDCDPFSFYILGMRVRLRLWLNSQGGENAVGQEL